MPKAYPAESIFGKKLVQQTHKNAKKRIFFFPQSRQVWEVLTLLNHTPKVYKSLCSKYNFPIKLSFCAVSSFA